MLENARCHRAEGLANLAKATCRFLSKSFVLLDISVVLIIKEQISGQSEDIAAICEHPAPSLVRRTGPFLLSYCLYEFEVCC